LGGVVTLGDVFDLIRDAAPAALTMASAAVFAAMLWAGGKVH
jgi:hypothetical protein